MAVKARDKARRRRTAVPRGRVPGACDLTDYRRSWRSESRLS